MNEAEKEQALKLSALFKELAEKGTWFEVYQKDIVGVWQKTDICPTLNSTLSEWIVADKPVEPKKIIVLTKCINTIDMEFARHDENWSIGKLDGIYGHSYPYSKLNCGDFECCRVRQNHIHYYDGKGNPLPDGLLVTLYFNNNNKSAGGTLTLKQGMDFNTYPSSEHQLRAEISFKSQDIDWDRLYNVSGYEVLEVLPEYKYGWEK